MIPEKTPFIKYVRKYFSIPPTGGFGPYRTGAGVHMYISSVLGGGVGLLCYKFTALSLAHIAAAVLASVFLLWGVTMMIAVLSHYSPLLSMGAIGGLVLFGAVFQMDGLKALLAGGAAHAVTHGILSLLGLKEG